MMTAIEARVLGCLIEKQIITPDVYPLTVNAAHAAANQKTAREPVMSLDPGAVQHALRELERKGVAKRVFSSRAERYEHRADACFSLPRAQLVLLCLLALRGAQTPHELLVRSERMHAFAGFEDVLHHLERLMRRTPALVALAPRVSGQREDRYVHLLCGAPDVLDEVEEAAPPKLFAQATRTSLESRVASLEADVAELRQRLDALAGQVPD